MLALLLEDMPRLIKDEKQYLAIAVGVYHVNLASMLHAETKEPAYIETMVKVVDFFNEDVIFTDQDIKNFAKAKAYGVRKAREDFIKFKNSNTKHGPIYQN